MRSGNENKWLSTNNQSVVVELLTHLRIYLEGPGSKSRTEDHLPDFFLWFFSVPVGKLEDNTSKLG
jgi:hypothetical protein